MFRVALLFLVVAPASAADIVLDTSVDLYSPAGPNILQWGTAATHIGGYPYTDMYTAGRAACTAAGLLSCGAHTFAGPDGFPYAVGWRFRGPTSNPTSDRDTCLAALNAIGGSFKDDYIIGTVGYSPSIWIAYDKQQESANTGCLVGFIAAGSETAGSFVTLTFGGTSHTLKVAASTGSESHTHVKMIFNGQSTAGGAIPDDEKAKAYSGSGGGGGGSGASGDPHLVFATGGKADFRGSHLDYYAFLSSPGYQFAPLFEEVKYMWHSPNLYKQVVDGTFMTRAAWTITTAKGRKVTLGADAMHSGTLNVTIDGVPSHLGRWSNLTVDELTVRTMMLSLTVEEPRWQVNLTAKPVYGQVELDRPWWQSMKKRLDISIKGAFPQPDAHGVIGQSYRDATVRDGKQDVYEAEISNVNELGIAPPLTTAAQAEGAIDGVHTQYKLASPFSTNWTFSRFEHVRAAPAATPLATRTAYTLEKNQPA